MSLGVQSNGFDAGTVGGPVSTSTVAPSGYGFHVSSTNSPVFTDTDAIFGTRSIEMARVSGSTLQVYTNNALSTLDVSFSFGFTYKTALPGTNDNLWDVVAGGSLVRCFTNSTGHPFVQLSGTTIGTATGAFVAGTKYRCDVRVHINATSGWIFCDFFDPLSSTPKFTGFAFTSQNTGSTAITDLFYGPYGANTVSVGSFVLDLCRFDDTQSSAYMAVPAPSNTVYNAARASAMGFWAQPGRLDLDFLPTTGVLGFSARPGVLTVGSASTTIHAPRASMGFAAVAGVLTTDIFGNAFLTGGPGSLGFSATPGQLDFSNAVQSRASVGFVAVPGVLTLDSHDTDVFISFGLTDRDQWSFGRADTA